MDCVRPRPLMHLTLQTSVHLTLQTLVTHSLRSVHLTLQTSVTHNLRSVHLTLQTSVTHSLRSVHLTLQTLVTHCLRAVASAKRELRDPGSSEKRPWAAEKRKATLGWAKQGSHVRVPDPRLVRAWPIRKSASARAAPRPLGKNVDAPRRCCGLTQTL